MPITIVEWYITACYLIVYLFNSRTTVRCWLCCRDGFTETLNDVSWICRRFHRRHWSVVQHAVAQMIVADSVSATSDLGDVELCQTVQAQCHAVDWHFFPRLLQHSMFMFITCLTFCVHLQHYNYTIDHYIVLRYYSLGLNTVLNAVGTCKFFTGSRISMSVSRTGNSTNQNKTTLRVMVHTSASGVFCFSSRRTWLEEIAHWYLPERTRCTSWLCTHDNSVITLFTKNIPNLTYIRFTENHDAHFRDKVTMMTW